MNVSKHLAYRAICLMLVASPYAHCTQLSAKEIFKIQPEQRSCRGFGYDGLLTLDLSKKKLTSIAGISELWVTPGIKKNNHMEAFDITKIKNLRLVLEKNKLKQVPEELKLLQLKKLDLSDNNLKEIPQWLLKMVGLKYLYLGGNKNLKKPTNYPKELNIIYNKYNN